MTYQTLSVFADYYQFYLQPCDDGPVELPNWLDDTIEQVRLAASGHAIAVRTNSSKVVPVVIEVVDSAPDHDVSGWDHVVEANMDVSTECVALTSPSVLQSEAQRIVLPSGSYRVRVYFGGLGSDDTEAESAENYRIVLWSTKGNEPIEVIKALKAS
jgi:hypothetical protein